ncbi:unnamed protein product [Rotaria sp. Silwood1]|nr:unnamed protein product [Rotaria sp. Silwood1]
MDLSEIKLKKFSITLQKGWMDQRGFRFLTWFIKQFSSSLIYLSLNLNEIYTGEFQFDGFTLQQQFLESMIQLKSFHLYTQFYKEPVNVESFLSTFQTQFWFDHHWTFGIHETYLYTIPFYFDNMKDFIDFDQIKSNNSVILNSSKTWSHVKSIDSSNSSDQIKSNNSVILNSSKTWSHVKSIGSSNSSKFSLNLIKQLKSKMPNLASITFSFKLMRNLFTNDNETNQTDITLDSVTTVHCEIDDLKTIKRWLINIFPNTRILILSFSVYSVSLSPNKMIFSQELDECFRGTDYMHFIKIQYVEVKLTFRDLDYINEHTTRLVKELLTMFKNLQSFIFHFHHMSDFLRMSSFTDLSKIIQLLNMEKVSEKYQIKHIHNYLQFVRKNDE